MKTIRLVGILLMVFVKNKYLSFVTEVDAETVATGIMGLMVRKISRTFRSYSLQPCISNPLLLVMCCAIHVCIFIIWIWLAP